MEFRRSVLAANETITANTVVSYDLPVDPLSHILFTILFAQNQANTQLSFANIAAVLSRIEVLYKGSAIYSMNGLDALAVGRFVCGFESWGVNAVGDDNDLLSFTFVIPMGRKLYDPRECYPVTSRGELILQVTYAASFTQIDGASAQIETVELPQASPEQFLKMTTLTLTPSATGQNDIDLPIGNHLDSLVLWGTTIPAANVATTTIDELEIRVNNVEKYYSRSFFESIHNSAGRRLPAPGFWGNHVHQMDAAAFAQYDDVSANKPSNHILANHLHVPFDIHQDGDFLLDARALSSFVLRFQAGDTNAMRCIPCEIVEASKGV